jgi:hypothetical protein
MIIVNVARHRIGEAGPQGPDYPKVRAKLASNSILTASTSHYKPNGPRTECRPPRIACR